MKQNALFFFIIIPFFLTAQVGIGTTEVAPSAILHIEAKSDSSYRGLLLPRVPDQFNKREIKPNLTDQGMMVYVRESKSLEIWNGKHWQSLHENAASGFADDLFISEYVEKSTGNNKAIEIANFTGGPKDLSEYALYINTNGEVPSNNNSPGNGGVSMTEVSLGTGILANGDVLVIRNSSATEISAGFDGFSPTKNFDGNDPIILKKKGEGQPWIDVVGVPGVNWIYGKAVTLRRKPGYGPSRFYVPGQFTVYPPGTYDGLGSHTF